MSTKELPPCPVCGVEVRHVPTDVIGCLTMIQCYDGHGYNLDESDYRALCALVAKGKRLTKELSKLSPRKKEEET